MLQHATFSHPTLSPQNFSMFPWEYADGWHLGFEERTYEGVGLIVRAISFQGNVVLIHQLQISNVTDRRMDDMQSQYRAMH